LGLMYQRHEFFARKERKEKSVKQKIEKAAPKIPPHPTLSRKGRG